MTASAGPPDPGALDGDAVLAAARGAVAARLRPAHSQPLAALPEWPAATFVTIYRGPQLHGCIGSLEPRRTLPDDLRHNAIMAAFHDPRSRALRPDELDAAHFGVSILGPRTPLSFTSEADARAQLRPGVDGLVLSWDGHRGVFLPQVWDQLPTPAQFLDQLKRKAGLPTDFWRPELTLERFEVVKFEEPKPRAEELRS